MSGLENQYVFVVSDSFTNILGVFTSLHRAFKASAPIAVSYGLNGTVFISRRLVGVASEEWMETCFHARTEGDKTLLYTNYGVVAMQANLKDICGE